MEILVRRLPFTHIVQIECKTIKLLPRTQMNAATLQKWGAFLCDVARSRVRGIVGSQRYNSILGCLIPA